MANSKFGLLDLADGESGEAAVSVAITKVEAAAAAPTAAAARKAEAASDAAGTGKEKAPHKNHLYFTKLQLDNGTCIHTIHSLSGSRCVSTLPVAAVFIVN